MINIVVPMAGAGSRFSNAGYSMPKPMIDIGNKKMIEIVINNIKPCIDHRFIFLCQESHLLNTKLRDVLTSNCDNPIIIALKSVTQGAAETVLSAEDYINNDEQLMIANCDQWIDIDINNYLNFFNYSNAQGLIMSMHANDEKWSYMKNDKRGFVTEIREKEVISNEASVGIYNFRYGKDFCRAAKKMINERELSRGEYYVAPVYNYLIDNDFKVVSYNIGKENEGMYGLGIPSDLSAFLTSQVLEKALDF